VFAILRSKRLGLKQNLRPLLELESGSNDPMAYILTIMLIQVNQGVDGSVGQVVVTFLKQMGIGALAGYLLGVGATYLINRINVGNKSLYSVLLLSMVFFIASFTDLLGGNGYLAVYIAGLVVGNNKLMHKQTLTTFFDSFTWLCQVIMFLALGLLVNIEELLQPDIIILGCLVGAFMILVARPVAVFACLTPFRQFTTKARLYISWVGLRGAVPIIFATYPVIEHIEGAELLFNIVFFVTLISMAVQGTTVSGMANALGLAYEEKASSFNEELRDQMTAAFSEVEVNRQMLVKGDRLSEIPLPDNTLVVMICRDGDYFVPRGNTELLEGDKLLVLSDRGDELDEQYKEMGVEEILKF
jgi:cell volume regulation protein A